jgi:transposase
MPRAYSADIRGRVIARVESGASRREATEDFEVNASGAVKWVQCCRDTGSCMARSRVGGTSPLEPADFTHVIAKQSDLTLDEVVATMRNLF